MTAARCAVGNRRAKSGSLRVLVVEDNEPFRLFVCSTLSKATELRIIGEVSDGLEAVRKADELQPDLILLDVGLPTLNGIEAARRIRKLSPESKILFVTAESDAEVVQEAFSLGGSGYIGKSNIGVELLAAVQAVCQGMRFIGAGLTTQVPEVRVAGANALGKMGSKGSIEKLRMLLKDKESSVVMAATESLKTLGDTHAYEVYFAILTGERKSGEGLLQDQLKMLHDPKKMAEFGFSEGIGYVPYAGLALGAYKVIHKDDISPVRALAAVALASDPDPRSGEALVTAASDKSLIVRTAALDAIGHRNDTSLIPVVVPMMNDEKDVVRYTAAAVVVRLSKIAK